MHIFEKQGGGNNIKLINILILWLLVQANAHGGDTPKEMLDNIFAISEMSAIASLCFDDSNVNPEQQIQFIEANIELGKLVQAIGDHYEDNSVYLTYVITAGKLQEDAALHRNISSRYGGCGKFLLEDLNSRISDGKSEILKFLSNN